MIPKEQADPLIRERREKCIQARREMAMTFVSWSIHVPLFFVGMLSIMFLLIKGGELLGMSISGLFETVAVLAALFPGLCFSYSIGNWCKNEIDRHLPSRWQFPIDKSEDMSNWRDKIL